MDGLFDLLFTTRIEEHLRYKSFSFPHMALLLASFCGVFLTARHVKKLDKTGKEKWLIFFTWALPFVYITRFIVFLLLDLFVEPQMELADRLPFHLCALNAIVMPIAVMKNNKTLLNYMYAVSLPAAAAAMLTPAMSYYGRYFYFSWQLVFFFLDHSLIVLIPIISILSAAMRPDIREFPKAAAFFITYCAFIYPINKIFGQNYLFLNYPDEGTVMAFFAVYLGNPGYLLPLAVFTAIIIFLMYLPWIMIDRKTK